MLLRYWPRPIVKGRSGQGLTDWSRRYNKGQVRGTNHAGTMPIN